MPAALLPLALALLAAPTQEKDRVELENGRVLEGTVVYEDDTTVLLRKGSRDQEIEKEKVKSVESRARALNALLDAFVDANAWSVEDEARLAAMARDSNLPFMERLFWWRVVVLDPQSGQANESLGHRRKSKAWRVKHGRKSMTLEKAREAASDFGNGWEFRTTHFLLRTNLELEAALDLALDLERLYMGFFDLFQVPLRLLEVGELMEVHVHADQGSFPEQSDQVGYFLPSDRITRVLATAAGYRTVFFHELVHQLIHFTAVRERTRNGAVAPWVDEGLAIYIASAVRGDPGKIELIPEAHDSRWFGEHAGAPKPLNLSRVLNLSVGDYIASSDRNLKYAQSYTLVHYLLHGDDGSMRQDFLDYLRSSYEGRGSPSDFKKQLSIRKTDDFEESWEAYVKKNAF